ncbi:heme ABC transporter ATP-binding protein [Jiella endophytica]|uniref:Heme ABC transporter ATP-binding protein n=1 Tax=Jiella endophytica TaxID=2558362 RepID=A0A4Y8RL66_9HYPH|nr:heme ABC transporter ATP-binding protein [Jiella endophytica]TFF23186.1 heme ABC transporter ATP-binding protein [Jiella endophytica]
MTMALDGVEVVAGGRRILGPVSFDLEPGSLTAVVGPNGAGKSTLVRAMSGERRLTAGNVRLHGEEVGQTSPGLLAARRAVLPQATTIAFPFTVFEIVGLGLRTRPGLTAARRRAIVAEALAAVDLGDFGPRPYPQLSGGEKQRVQLARVLCQIGAPVEDGRSKLLILDEPTSSLDVRHQIDVLAIARRFADEGGTVVAVLHDLNLAAGFSDRMIVLDSGLVVADGDPAELLPSDVLPRTFGAKMAVLHPPGWRSPVVLPEILGRARVDQRPRSGSPG